MHCGQRRVSHLSGEEDAGVSRAGRIRIAAACRAEGHVAREVAVCAAGDRLRALAGRHHDLSRSSYIRCCSIAIASQLNRCSAVRRAWDPRSPRACGLRNRAAMAWAIRAGSSSITTSLTGSRLRPFTPVVVLTIGFAMAIASMILMLVPAEASKGAITMAAFS